MTTQAVLEAIASWSSKAKLASLEMPTGWLGRPYDNLQQLTWSAATEDKVLVELDKRHMSITMGPAASGLSHRQPMDPKAPCHPHTLTPG